VWVLLVRLSRPFYRSIFLSLFATISMCMGFDVQETFADDMRKVKPLGCALPRDQAELALLRRPCWRTVSTRRSTC
jgi:hypothetical protein